MSTPDRIIPAETVEALLLDTAPYLSCDECFEQIDTYVERILSDPGHRDVAMQTHLRACGACAEEAETLAELLQS
ncbi:MAG: hypothetical protein L0H31_07305 [Nocardioidaceae bacterium]|nr:hypothetical protein [Nocardioidaceae bacterium]